MSAQSASLSRRPGFLWLQRALSGASAGSVLRLRRPSSSQVRLATAGWLITAVLAGGLLGEVLLAPAARSQPQVQVAGLQCRLAGGPWQPCRMEVQDVGLQWVLRIGDQRIDFRHSGDGAVRMQKGTGPWQSVTASWQPDTSLCWDGVCAKGDIPLD